MHEEGCTDEPLPGPWKDRPVLTVRPVSQGQPRAHGRPPASASSTPHCVPPACPPASLRSTSVHIKGSSPFDPPVTRSSLIFHW